MRKGRRQMTPAEICKQQNLFVKEYRMATQSTWTAMAILCCYTMLTAKGFKAKRCQDLMAAINKYEDRWWDMEINLEAYQERLMQKAGWNITQEDYTEADIKYKKGTFEWYVDRSQIDAQNEINRVATRFFTWFYNVLIDEGYGEKRLMDVFQTMDEQMSIYRKDKTLTAKWKQELLDRAGLIFEPPVDPLTKKRGSVMC